MTSSLSAQIVTDGTVGPAGSLSGPDFVITDTLGVRVGPNLFHSFSDFNVRIGESATFTSGAPGITNNVIGRVTGASPTVIDGLLRSTIPGADLWLLNPNGLVFGVNASLDVPAGFHASTADVLRLADGGEFRATNPGASSLTVANPAAFGFLDAGIGPIRIEGAQLGVVQGERLSLIGGEQTHLGSVLLAPSGRVALVAVASAGDVDVAMAGAPASIFPAVRANLDIDSGSRIFAGTAGPAAAGDVLLVGNAISLLDGSIVDAGTSGAGAGGTVTVLADIGLGIIGPASAVLADSRAVGPGAGPAGIVAISGNQLFVEQGLISTGALAGAAGSIVVDVEDLAVVNGAALTSSSQGVASSGDVGITGSVTLAMASELRAGGEVTITGPSVSLADRGRVEAETIRLNVDSLNLTLESVLGAEVLRVSGRNGAPAGSVALSEESFMAADTTINAREIGLSGQSLIGAAGAPIVLLVDRLFVSGGSQIGVGSVGGLDGGSIEIRGATAAAADYINVGGFGRSGSPSRITAGADFVPLDSDTGSGGPISITARTIEIVNGGEIASSASARGGGGGAITIEVDELRLSNGAMITSTTLGGGDAGSVSVRGASAAAANVVSITGAASGIFTASEGRLEPIAGRGGAILILAEAVDLLDGATLSSSTRGGGDGGTIDLRVGNLRVENAGTISAATGLFSEFATTFEGTGNAGAITIGGLDGAAESVIVSGIGSGIFSDSRLGGANAGAAGTVSLQARSVQLSDFGAIGVSTVDGAGGTLQLFVEDLTVDGAAALTAATSGRGQAGDISVEGPDGAAARRLVVRNDGRIDSGSLADAADAGAGGTIGLTAQAIALEERALITASTRGGGSGGSVGIQVEDLALSGASGIFTNTVGSGDAGDIRIVGLAGPARSIDIAGNFSMIVSDSQLDQPGAGRAGSVVMAARTIDVTDFGLVSVQSWDGGGGTIELQVEQLTLDGGGWLAAVTRGTGNAGDIAITGIDGGRADRISLRNAGRIDSGSSSLAATAGDSGTIRILADLVELDAGASVAARMNGGGAGGSVSLDVDILRLQGASGIYTSTLGSGDAGDIVISGVDGVARLVEITGADSGLFSDSLTIGASAGRAGSVDVSARTLAVRDGGSITVATVDGVGGSIVLAVDTLENSGLITAAVVGGITSEFGGSGSGGNIVIRAGTVRLHSGGIVSVLSTGSGAAGSVFMDADIINLSGGSRIDATSAGSLAGNVELNVRDILWLQDSLISGLSADPDNDGGSFVVEAPRALVLQRSSILANSASSSGGNIRIVANAIVLDPDSNVEATGELLTAGEVLGGVLQLEAPELLDAGAALDTRCTPQQVATRSTMIVRSTPAGAVHEPYLMGSGRALRACNP